MKLKKHNQTLTLSTFEKEKFIELYLHLSKICILTRFATHYRVGNELGAGTFGTVYDGINLCSS